MNTYQCKFCGEDDFKSGQIYGAHLVNCKYNPEREIKLQKMRHSRKDKIITEKKCLKCSKKI